LASRYVALDLETTGLDPDSDEVIEVAAVAFDDERVLATLQTLVRPWRTLPFQIQRLTGIRAADLEGAPPLAAVLGDLAEFLDGLPVVGQNIAFDAAFLERAGLRIDGPRLDTFDLAQLLLPGLGEYSLRSIAANLGIDFPVRHRATADAEAARRVFLALRRRLAALPAWLLLELQRLARAAEWSLEWLVAEILAQAPALDGELPSGSRLLARPVEAGRPPAPAAVRLENGVGDLLARAATLTDAFPAFERRPEQEAMAEAVAAAFRDEEHLVVEAGTGTGKSLAYLLPAAAHALSEGERVVVSTDTIGLQEQLFGKDLPVVQRIMREVSEEPLRVAALKGRRNYLCLLRWTAARHGLPASKEEARLLARLLVWLTTTQTGDRAELNLPPGYEAAWARLSSENTNCLETPCHFVKEGTCFLWRARRRAEAAHILVVNHALLLSDMATGGRVLPPYDRLVIDEAHNLEEEATERFAFRCARADIEEFTDLVARRGERGGIVAGLADAMRGQEILGPGAYLAGLAPALTAAAARVRQRATEPYRLLEGMLRDLRETGRESDDRLLITRAVRVQPRWSDVEVAAENLDAALDDLAGRLGDLCAVLEEASLGLMDQEALAADAADLFARARGLRAGLAAALLEGEATLICWLERARDSGEVVVCSAPLEVASILREELFAVKGSVVLTSATLSAQGSFSFIRERLGLDDARELLLGSPFDFPRSTLIALPSDLPEPDLPDFAAAAAGAVAECCRASEGRALVLFTSYGALNAMAAAIRAPLEAEGILVLAQGIDGSPKQLLSALRENSRTVLLGAASFWEGVDVAGDALSLLVIARLPFPVPTDPVYVARSGLYDNPFEEYALPLAVLRFRQGFGRLIRTKTDRGVLVVLDTRLRGRRYGEAFLRSLPRCTLREMPARDLPAAVRSWLA
jgi:predicted DnaQ family exonuclease/DinG family helicase